MPDLDLLIRPMLASDETAVAGLVSDDRSADLHGPLNGEPRPRRSLVALIDGSIVGVATSLRSARHPARLELAVHVRPDWRRRGVATHLLIQLRTAGGQPLQAVIEADNEAGRAFLLARGFGFVVSSRSGRFDVVGAHVETEPLPVGYRIVAAEIDDSVVDLYERLYDEAHWWTNGYVRYARGVPWFSFVGPPVLGTTFVALDGFGALVAVLGLSNEDLSTSGERSAFLVPGGVLHGARRSGAVPITATLASHVVDAARRVGITTIRWEEDDPYVELRTVLQRLPIHVEERLEVYADG
jgi:GNAT superfamily N-acetyltransferase